MTTGIPLNAGTSANAGVAQTAHNAQQLARQRDRRKADEAKDAARLKKLFELRLAAPEEVEHEQPAAALHVDGRVPQQQHQQPIDKLDVHHRPAEPTQEQVRKRDAAPTAPPADDRGGLYRHLDLTA